MYTDLYLSFPNEAAAKAVLYTERDGKPVQNYQNTDTIGVIYKGGKWDSQGKVLEAPVAQPGWHVNVRLVQGEDAGPLQPYVVSPSTPVRVWG